MIVAFIFLLVIVGSVAFHFWTPWWWTEVASNWGNIDDTIILTFWVTGTVFVAICLFTAYCVWRFQYKEDRKNEYPDLGEQFDKIFHAIDADSDLKTKFSDFHTAIKAVKDKYPKPE